MILSEPVRSFCQQAILAIPDLVSQARLALQDSLDLQAFLETLVQRDHRVDLAVLDLKALLVHFIYSLVRSSIYPSRLLAYLSVYLLGSLQRIKQKSSHLGPVFPQQINLPLI